MAANASLITDFHIGTVNVHQFQHPKSHLNNATELASVLAPLNLDIFAVEEARNDHVWELLCKKLSLPYAAFGPSHGRSYGNAIASRYPIIEYSNKKSVTGARGGDRAMLFCRFGGDHPFIQNRRFAVTHLDHINEDDRLVQIKEFAPHCHNVNILIGDMNSLTRDDYSDEYYHDVVAGKREKSFWEKPCFELTNQLTNIWFFQDSFRQANPKLKDEQVATCPYGTRIDYIFFRPLANDEWLLKECFIVDTHQATDHQAVVATFQHKSKVKNNDTKTPDVN